MIDNVRVIVLSVVVLSGAFTAFAQAPPASDQPPLLATVPTPPPGTPSVPQSMAGAPLQVGDLPPGTITVRVIRGSFDNNVVSQAVIVHLDRENRTLTGTTGPEGRAQFVGATVGAPVWVEATVDGERLTSQTFEVPARGGVRLVLSTTAGAAVSSAPPAESPVVPVVAQAGLVTPPVSPGKSPAQWMLAGLFIGASLGFGAHAYLSRRARLSVPARSSGGDTQSHP
ncbi:MAG: hypothetical protein AB7I50_13040 [Vicinamibacterales bacterium]